MSKHTPGPWECMGGAGATVVVADGDSVVASLRDRFGGSVAHDARLIAAAPELLEALQKIGALSSSPDAGKMAMDRALSAIEEIVSDALSKVNA